MVVEERVARLQNKCRGVARARATPCVLGESIVRRERTNERASRRGRENAETPYIRPGFAEAAPTCLLREQPRGIPHFSHSARLPVSSNRTLLRGFPRSSQLPPHLRGSILSSGDSSFQRSWTVFEPFRYHQRDLQSSLMAIRKRIPSSFGHSMKALPPLNHSFSDRSYF